MKQRRIGLTGGIASGKSTVGQVLSHRFGLPVLDADLYARQALAPGTDASAAVLARYGAAVLAGDGAATASGPRKSQDQERSQAGDERAGLNQGLHPDPTQDQTASPEAGAGASRPGAAAPATAPSIDRAALGRIVFAEAAERQWLENLLHPLVRRRFAQELERLGAAPVVVLMIPLLFEAGLQDLCDEVWLVSCDESRQLARLIARDGLSEAAARQRLAAQWPLARKRALADVVIANDGSRDALLTEVERLLGHAPADADGT